MTEFVVTAHQTNWIPGWNVIAKTLAADAVVWMNALAYSRGSFTNRQRIPGPDGEWLTVPVPKGSTGQPICDVKLDREGMGAFRQDAKLRLRRAYGDDVAVGIDEILSWPWSSLGSLNFEVIRWCYGQLKQRPGVQFLQRQIETWPPSGDISERHAQLVAVVGREARRRGDQRVYLSGPSGREYLSMEPFERRGIELRFYEHPEPPPHRNVLDEILGRRS